MRRSLSRRVHTRHERRFPAHNDTASTRRLTLSHERSGEGSAGTAKARPVTTESSCSVAQTRQAETDDVEPGVARVALDHGPSIVIVVIHLVAVADAANRAFVRSRCGPAERSLLAGRSVVVGAVVSAAPLLPQ
jgi:hypothetical protein